MAATSIEREDILNLLASLPNEGWQEVSTTKDQQELLDKSRHIYSYIANAWKEYHPLEPAPEPPDEVVKDKKLKRLIVRLITPFVATCNALWQLTVYAYPKFKNQFPDEKSFPFQSDVELFKEMIVELVDYDLVDCTLPYFKFSPRSMEPQLIDLSKFWEKGASFKPHKLEKLNKLIKDSSVANLKWHLSLLRYAQDNQKEDPSLAKHYQAVQQATAEIFVVLSKAAHHHSHVFEWFNGTIKQ